MFIWCFFGWNFHDHLWLLDLSNAETAWYCGEYLGTLLESSYLINLLLEQHPGPQAPPFFDILLNYSFDNIIWGRCNTGKNMHHPVDVLAHEISILFPSHQRCFRYQTCRDSVPYSRLFWGWEIFPYISRIHTSYIGEDSSILSTWNAWWSKGITVENMAGQPPPLTNPPRNKGLIKPYKGKPVVNKLWLESMAHGFQFSSSTHRKLLIAVDLKRKCSKTRFVKIWVEFLDLKVLGSLFFFCV